MSKIKNMPGVAWLVIGVLATLLVIPTTAYAAAALKFTGIEGTSANKADVAPTGQVLTAPAYPSQLATYSAGVDSGFECEPVTPVLTSQAFVLRDLFNDFSYTPPQSTYSTYVTFEVNPASNTNCTFEPSGFLQNVNPANDETGTVDYPFPAGYVIPPGYRLYMEGWNNVTDQVTANGYLIPAADAPSTPAAQYKVNVGAAETLPKPST